MYVYIYMYISIYIYYLYSHILHVFQCDTSQQGLLQIMWDIFTASLHLWGDHVKRQAINHRWFYDNWPFFDNMFWRLDKITSPQWIHNFSRELGINVALVLGGRKDRATHGFGAENNREVMHIIWINEARNICNFEMIFVPWPFLPMPRSIGCCFCGRLFWWSPIRFKLFSNIFLAALEGKYIYILDIVKIYCSRLQDSMFNPFCM